MTFGALEKGQRFRIWRHAGTGINSGYPAQLSAKVYTKVSKGACKDADGQWHDVLSGTSVQVVDDEAQSHEPGCGSNFGGRCSCSPYKEP